MRAMRKDAAAQGSVCSVPAPALFIASVASLHVSRTEGVRIQFHSPQIIKGAWRVIQNFIDVHVPCLNAFLISSLAGSSFSACSNATTAFLQSCAYGGRDWIRLQGLICCGFHLPTIPLERRELHPHGTIPSTNQDASLCTVEHLTELGPLLSAATSICSGWQTMWHQMDLCSLPALNNQKEFRFSGFVAVHSTASVEHSTAPMHNVFDACNGYFNTILSKPA